MEATQELERAVFVSFPLRSALWGRASAPSGCSPRDSGAVGSNLILLSCIDRCSLQQLDSYWVSVFNRLLETHRRLKERLAAKEEELCVAAGTFLACSFLVGAR